MTQQVVPYGFPDSCPTPTPTPELSAVTLTAAELAKETCAEPDRAERILAVVSAIGNRVRTPRAHRPAKRGGDSVGWVSRPIRLRNGTR